MKFLKYTCVAAAFIFSTQAGAAIVDDTTWILKNDGKRPGGFIQFGLGDDDNNSIDIERNGAELVAKYINNTLTIIGTGYDVGAGKLINISLTYDDIKIHGNTLKAADRDLVGHIGDNTLHAKRAGSRSLILVADNANSITVDGWFAYTNGVGYGDIHTSGHFVSPPTTSVSETNVNMALLGTLGLLGFAGYRRKQKAY